MHKLLRLAVTIIALPLRMESATAQSTPQPTPQPTAQSSDVLANTQSMEPLTGTRWTVNVADGCTDTLIFKPDHRVSDYSCEAGEWYKGTYTMNKDTVIETCVSRSEDGGGEERWRVRYLYRGAVLSAINSQSFSHGKWDKAQAVTGPKAYKRIQ